jgi:hypothetical protein
MSYTASAVFLLSKKVNEKDIFAPWWTQKRLDGVKQKTKIAASAMRSGRPRHKKKTTATKRSSVLWRIKIKVRQRRYESNDSREWRGKPPSLYDEEGHILLREPRSLP